MLEIRIETFNNRIKTYSAIGHSNNSCGAVTCVSRTFVMLARELSGVVVNFDAPHEGEFSFEVFEEDLSTRISSYLYLDGFTKFVLKAIKDLEMEFPDEVKVIVKEKV